MDDVSLDELRVQFDQEVQTLKVYGFISPPLHLCSNQHSVSSNVYERTQTSCVWSRPLNQSKWFVHTDSPLRKHVSLQRLSLSIDFTFRTVTVTLKHYRRLNLKSLSVPQVEARELGGHGWLLLWRTVPVFGVRPDGQRLPSGPTGLPGERQLHRRTLCSPRIGRDEMSSSVCRPFQQGTPPLSWQQRCSIAEGTARGLEYLHSSHHVHRDIKRYSDVVLYQY